MKKLVLMLLTFGCVAQSQAQLVHSARDIFINAITQMKSVVTAHPMLSVAVGCTAVAICYWYTKQQDEDQDPSFASFKKYWEDKPSSTKASPTVSPTDSPSHSADTLKDFTGDFPNTQSKTLHPTKLRHN